MIEVVRYILIALEALCSLLLIGLVLIQKSKGEGLGMAFGGGGGDALFGSRAGNVMTKATVILAVIFMVNTLLLGVLFSGTQNRSVMGEFAAAPVQQVAPQPAAQAVPAESAAVPTLPGADLDGGAPADAAPAAE